MPETIEALAESALLSKNTVITTFPGIGTMSKILYTVEEAGLSIGYLNLAHYADFYATALCTAGGELRMETSQAFLRAEALVLDGGAFITPHILEVVTTLMTDRRLYGMMLPNAQTVIVVFTDDEQGNALKLAAIPDSVTVNIR